MDVLSDVLRVIRLSGAVFFTADLLSPWAFTSPPSTDLEPLLNRPADCLSLFHILIEGECWFRVENQAPVRVEANSVISFPHGDGHVMSSDPELKPVSIYSLMPPFEHGKIPHVTHGRTGERARIVCGYLQCDRRFNPLIGALPHLLVVRSQKNGMQSADATEAWLDLTLKRASDEADAKRPGSPALLARITELLFLVVLQRHTQHLPDGQGGWLAAVRDPEIGRALRLLHEQPERKWTTVDLGHAVGVSRAALARRFADLVGEPPMRYLTSWRMQLAQHYLSQRELSLAEVAVRVGYDSDVAFNRAFRRHVGTPPATWRDEFA